MEYKEKEVELSHIVLAHLGYDIINFKSLKSQTSNIKYELKDEIITKNGVEVNHLEIPSTYIYGGEKFKITKVENNCFLLTQSLVSIKLPDSITEIGEYAFWECKNLETIQIPDSVEKIRESAFWECESLKDIQIPKKLKKIEKDTFKSCKSLKNIIIPDSVVEIGESAFENCTSLEKINIPDSVIEIGNSVFAGCSSLITAIIPNKVTKISEALFSNCTSLVNVTIPNGVTEIEDEAFADCVALPNILIPKTVTKIGKQAFVNCKKFDIFVIPDSVTDIGLEAFGGCSKIQHFTLPTRFTVFKDDVNKQIDLTSKGNSSFKNAKVGDFIKFGNYSQTSNAQNQSIEWQVLSIENNKMLVISRYGLETRCFDSSSNNWKNSEIRQWLNNEFYNKVFTDQEKKSINFFNLSDVGTSDNVFLLSRDEAERYFANDEARKCKATDYVLKKNNWSDGYWCWWLRSPNPNGSRSVYYVDVGGGIICSNRVNISGGVVRPALWINL